MNKLADLETIMTSNYSIIFLCETWLSSKIVDNEILRQNAPHYTIHRQDRNTKGGGAAILIHSTIPSALIQQESVKDSLELLAVDICLDSELIRLICVYRTPKCNEPFTYRLLQTLADLCTCPHPSIITGDFNFPAISWSSQSNGSTLSKAETTFLSFVSDLTLHQFVRTPTRGQNILDLLLSNQPLLVSHVDTGPPIANSDHNSITFKLNIDHSPPTFVYKRDFRSADYSAMSQRLDCFHRLQLLFLYHE